MWSQVLLFTGKQVFLVGFSLTGPRFSLRIKKPTTVITILVYFMKSRLCVAAPRHPPLVTISFSLGQTIPTFWVACSRSVFIWQNDTNIFSPSLSVSPTLYFYVLFWHFFVVFHHKICIFIIFISFSDKVSNFRNRNINQAETWIGDFQLSAELFARACQARGNEVLRCSRRIS